MTHLQEVEAFFGELFQGCGDGYVAFVRVPEGDWTKSENLFFARRNGVLPLPPALSSALQLGTLSDEWYFVPTLLGQQRRRKEDVVEGSALWIDIDNPAVNPYDMTPVPSVVIRTSEGKHHCYWLLDDAQGVANLEHYNRALAYTYAGDKGGWDACQLLRVPHTVNLKQDPQPVELVKLEPNDRYSLDAFNNLKAAPEDAITLDFGQSDAPLDTPLTRE